MTRKSKSRKRKFGSKTKEEGCEEFFQPGDSCEKVKKNYRENAKIHHPDKNPGDTEKFKELNECYEKAEKVCDDQLVIEDTKPEVLLLTDEKDPLKDLEKDFPQSKESSISFPNIDKVNKKLSDLFDYIGKYTMEESEETKELEKQQIEAEIELAKAEAKQAIRESERKFGFGSKSNDYESNTKDRLGGGELDKELKEQIRRQVEKDQNLKIQEDNKKILGKISKNVKEHEEKRKKIIQELQKLDDDAKIEEFDITNKEFKKEIEKLLTNSGQDKKGLTISEVEKEKFFGFLDQLANLNVLSGPDFQIFTLLLMKIMAYIFTKKENKNKKGKILTEKVERFLFESTKKVGDNLDIIEIISGFTPPGSKGFRKLANVSDDLKEIEQEIAKKTTEITNSETEQRLLQKELTRSTSDSETFMGHFTEQIEIAKDEIYDGIAEAGQKIFKQINKEIDNFKAKNEIDDDLNLIDYCNECKDNDEHINSIIQKNEKMKEYYESYNKSNSEIDSEDLSTMLETKKEWNLLNYNNTGKAQEIYEKAYNDLKIKIKNIYEKIALAIKDDEKLMKNEYNKSIVTTYLKEELLDEYIHETPFSQNIESFMDQVRNLITQIDRKIYEHTHDLLADSKKLSKTLVVLNGQKIQFQEREKTLTELKLQGEKYYDVLFETLEEQSRLFQLSYEQGQKVAIMFQSFGYDGLDGFIKDNSEKYDLVDKIRKKYINFKILEKNDFESEDSSKILKLKELLGKCTEVIKNSRDSTKQNTIQGEFMNIYNIVNKIILEAFPVKSIINFSTNVKPPDEGGSSRETYTAGINYEQNTDEILKKKFTKNNVNMLDKAGQTPEIPDKNPQGTIKEELGKGLAMIKSKDKEKTYGPFYKIFHTSNKDKDKKQYDIKEDLNRFFDPKDNLDHITYAGYGFSGSGKTYTLIEGKGESYNSIVNQISEYISKQVNNDDIGITIYEKYKEIIDGDCTDKFIGGSFEPPVDILKDNVNIKGLAGAISVINKEREKNIKGGPDSKYYRTSIRRTTYNPESSRAHLFVDIKFKVDGKDKKITVMDMAGSEKVNVIQEDYFKSVKKFEVKDSTWFSKEITAISSKLGKIKGYDTARRCNISSQNKAIRNEFIKSSKTKRDNYIIPVRWQELFFGNPVGDFEKDEEGYFKIHETEEELKHSISLVQGWIKDSLNWKEHKDFIRDYNDYQFTAKFKLLFDFNSILKEALEEPGTQLQIAEYLRGNPTQGTFPKKPDNFEEDLKDRIEGLFSMNGITIKGVVKNFYNIEKIYQEQSIIYDSGGRTVKQKTYNGIFSMGMGTTAADKISSFINTISTIVNKLKKMFKPNGEDKSNVYKQKKEIESKIGESLKGYKITKKWNYGDSFEEVKEIVKTAYNKKETWDRTMISKYHCPLRFQGKAIMTSIRQFKENLQNLNKQKVNFSPNNKNFPYNVNKWVGTGLNNKNFVIFTNIRLDFTNVLCENPKYVPICNAYDDSLDFSHELLYGEDEQQEVDKNYEEKVNRRFDICFMLNKNGNVGRKGTLKEKCESYEMCEIKKINNNSGNFKCEKKFGEKKFGEKKFGKKVSKKTSTRSFRKRGRRRGPSETEIL